MEFRAAYEFTKIRLNVLNSIFPDDKQLKTDDNIEVSTLDYFANGAHIAQRTIRINFNSCASNSQANLKPNSQ